MGAIAIRSVSLNWWGNHNAKAVSGEWEVGEVISGDQFRAKKENQTEMIKLCGISAPYAEAKEDLESLIKRGDGKVYLSKVGNSHEVWVLLSPDNEEQIHLNTWLVQNGMAKHDKNSSHCPNQECDWMDDSVH